MSPQVVSSIRGPTISHSIRLLFSPFVPACLSFIHFSAKYANVQEMNVTTASGASVLSRVVRNTEAK